MSMQTQNRSLKEDLPMKRLTISLWAVFFAFSAHSIPLQDMYSAAGAGAGYEKMIVLDPAEIYTGGLHLSNESVCIISCGAQVDLQGDRIMADDNALLDICGVVLTNSDSAALQFMGSADGWVDHCTFCGNYDGLYFWTGSNLKATSNIFAYSNHYGVKTIEGVYRWLEHNDAYENIGGDYKQWCAG